jgi:hypothetical protein
MSGFLIIAIVLFVVGPFLIVSYLKQKKKAEAISGIETTTAAALKEIWQGVAGEIGSGSFEEPAEVKGMLECGNPIESEIAKQSCAYYRMSVTRKWEETYYETDSEGNRQRKTRQGSDTVSSNTRSVPFLVRDDTGTVKVNPNGAKIDGDRVVDRFEPESAASSGTISFGNFSLSLGGLSTTSGRRTLGYQFSETILPLNRRLYILGSASDSSGELMIQKPREKGQFIISLKSEEELIKSSQSGMKWSLIGAIACFAVGIVFIILHFMQ